MGQDRADASTWGVPPPRYWRLGTQSNRLDTERSSLIRWIASAISGAIVS
jgi:hypothetical protein